MEIGDFSGTKWVTMFADQVQKLTEKTADEIGTLKETNVSFYDEEKLC